MSVYFVKACLAVSAGFGLLALLCGLSLILQPPKPVAELLARRQAQDIIIKGSVIILTCAAGYGLLAVGLLSPVVVWISAFCLILFIEYPPVSRYGVKPEKDASLWSIANEEGEKIKTNGYRRFVLFKTAYYALVGTTFAILSRIVAPEHFSLLPWVILVVAIMVLGYVIARWQWNTNREHNSPTK